MPLTPSITRNGTLAALLIAAVVGLSFTTPAQAQPTITPAWTEYTRAQVIDWIDDETFAVGRWDGSLAIFRLPDSETGTPELLQSRVSGDGAGVEMVAALDTRTIIFSDGPTAVALWIRTQAKRFGHYYRFTHDATLGIANSVTVVPKTNLIVTGHANGFAQVWDWQHDTLTPVRIIDLRSADPIPSPYPIKNIRGLAAWRDGIVLSGSEDGDIVAFRAADGNILFRQRYNPSAQRGINNVSLIDDRLLIANCSVGSNDNNLWLYEVTNKGFNLLDAKNLIKDTTLPQSFNFDADLYMQSDTLRFFASTEEGLLWSGSIENGSITIDGIGNVSVEGGAILDVNPSNAFLAAAAHKIHIFQTD